MTATADPVHETLRDGDGPVSRAPLLQGAQAQQHALAIQVSRQAAGGGESWIAISAQLAADYAILSAALAPVLEQSDLSLPRSSVVPTPVDLGPSIDGSGGVSAATDCAQVVKTHRAAVLSRLPAGGAQALSGHLDPLTHLQGLQVPDPGQPQHYRQDRAGTMSAHDLRHERRAHARWLATAAQVLAGRRGLVNGGAAEALEEDVFRAAHRSDLASFEAHLAEHAVHSGDWTLVTLEVSWRIAALRLRTLAASGLPPEVVEALRVTRAAMTASSWVQGQPSEPLWELDLSSL